MARGGTNGQDVALERLIFLTGSAAAVPLAWTALLEQEFVPPLRVDTWSELLGGRSPDAVFVFEDRYSEHAPCEPTFAKALAATRWVAVLNKPSADAVRDAVDRGYHEVLDLHMEPALVLGPLLRLRELRKVSETTQRLLEESMSAYEELQWLDRIRELLRLLDSDELVSQMATLCRQALGAAGARVWRPPSGGAEPGCLALAAAQGALDAGTAHLELHAIPRSAEILGGHAVQVEWQGRQTVWLPIVDANMLIALIELPRLKEQVRLLHREEARLRMLAEWLRIALANARETEQMRRVLRSRFGEFFAAPAFRQHLDKALVQASRYHRPLTLVALRYDGAESLRRRIYGAVLELLRDADVFEDPDDGGGRILLPETNYLGGVQFLRRMQRELAQKFPRHALRDLTTAVACYPDHGRDVEQLFARLGENMQRAVALRPVVQALREAVVAEFPELLAQLPQVVAVEDPNQWADMAFHLVQEATVIRPEQTRMLLFLGTYQESVRTFASLFEYPARWDRILVAAGIAAEGSVPASHLVRLVRDEALADTYLAVLERPRGSTVAWTVQRDGVWRGGLSFGSDVARTVINRFEDQYMLHHRWIVGTG